MDTEDLLYTEGEAHHHHHHYPTTVVYSGMFCFWLPPWFITECTLVYDGMFHLWISSLVYLLRLPLWPLMECSASGRPRPNVSQISCLESGMG